MTHLPFNEALAHHLRYKLYPPVGFLVHEATRAIRCCVEGQPEAMIGLPIGMMAAAEVVEGLRLEHFVGSRR